MLEFWGDLGFIVFAASSTLFTIMFLTMSSWWRTFMGNLIALFMLGVVIITAYFSLRIWGVPVPGVEWVRLVVFWVLGTSMFASSIGFLEIQFGKRAEGLRNRLAKRYTDVKKKSDERS